MRDQRTLPTLMDDPVCRMFSGLSEFPTRKCSVVSGSLAFILFWSRYKDSRLSSFVKFEMHFSVRRLDDNLNSRMYIWFIRYVPNMGYIYGPYDMKWVRGVNPVNHKVRGTNVKFKIILEQKCLKVRNVKMHNPRMGVPEIRKDFDL